MNLIPIDTGGTPAELVGGDASPGGDFAALMTGLMTGDTQIVPSIDIPAGEQLPEGADAATQDETGDVAATILEFIGTPPAGLTISPLSHSASTEVQESVDGAAESAASGLDSMAAASEPDTTIGQPLATVHPLHVANTASAVPGTDTTSDMSVTGLVEPGPSEQQTGAAAPASAEAGPEIAVAPSSQPQAHADTEAPGAPPFPTAETQVRASATRQSTTEPDGSQTSPHQAGGDAHLTESEVDVDTGTAPRPLDAARPGSAITQPAMVGIARRVEEAIAALATKPDPKIVTLQLDELDGLRLTVALRPDGIHLSSSGDAALTVEIERALASRGFDMAAGGDRRRQTSEENTDDGWRPQPATPGRQARPNQSGIRL